METYGNHHNKSVLFVVNCLGNDQRSPTFHQRGPPGARSPVMVIQQRSVSGMMTSLDKAPGKDMRCLRLQPHV